MQLSVVLRVIRNGRVHILIVTHEQKRKPRKPVEQMCSHRQKPVRWAQPISPAAHIPNHLDRLLYLTLPSLLREAWPLWASPEAGTTQEHSRVEKGKQKKALRCGIRSSGWQIQWHEEQQQIVPRGRRRRRRTLGFQNLQASPQEHR